jgi:HD superfamily phosphohydrolase
VLTAVRASALTGAVPAGAPGKPKSPPLCKQAQAGQFLLKFGKWQSKMQKKLRTDTSAHNTLVALQLWNSYVYFDDARCAVVSYVTKRLKRAMRSSSNSSSSSSSRSKQQQQDDDEKLLREWSQGIHREAQAAAEKLAQVKRHTTTYSILLTASARDHQHSSTHEHAAKCCCLELEQMRACSRFSWRMTVL